MKKTRSYLFLLLALLLCLAGCEKKGKLNEGDCPGVVTFAGLPKEFSLLDENLQKEYGIKVTLTNLTTERTYDVTLNQDNDFKQPLSLHPGKYSVKVYSTMENLVHLPVKVAQDSEIVTFDRGLEASVVILPENVEEFTRHWMETHPEAEILSADKFSSLVQINRKVMPIKDVITELDLSDMDKTLEASQKATLSDQEHGISITLQNQASTPQPLSKCEVISLSVTKNTVVFPDGVTLGSSPDRVCHRVTGLYGEPTRIEGMFLYGWDLDETKAVYLDPISGDKITITIAGDGSSIRQITYDLKVFE